MRNFEDLRKAALKKGFTVVRFADVTRLRGKARIYIVKHDDLPAAKDVEVMWMKDAKHQAEFLEKCEKLLVEPGEDEPSVVEGEEEKLESLQELNLHDALPLVRTETDKRLLKLWASDERVTVRREVQERFNQLAEEAEVQAEEAPPDTVPEVAEDEEEDE